MLLPIGVGLSVCDLKDPYRQQAYVRNRAVPSTNSTMVPDRIQLARHTIKVPMVAVQSLDKAIWIALNIRYRSTLKRFENWHINVAFIFDLVLIRDRVQGRESAFAVRN